MPRRRRRELVGKQEDYERFLRERALEILERALRRQWRQGVSPHANTPFLAGQALFSGSPLGIVAYRSVL